jgi:hypothetical protein
MRQVRSSIPSRLCEALLKLLEDWASKAPRSVCGTGNQIMLGQHQPLAPSPQLRRCAALGLTLPYGLQQAGLRLRAFAPVWCVQIHAAGLVPHYTHAGYKNYHDKVGSCSGEHMGGDVIRQTPKRAALGLDDTKCGRRRRLDLSEESCAVAAESVQSSWAAAEPWLPRGPQGWPHLPGHCRPPPSAAPPICLQIVVISLSAQLKLNQCLSL